jgi:uroporphyrinogen III methyltransferase / synthase
MVVNMRVTSNRSNDIGDASPDERRGRVALVGGGPGDPKLLTLAAVEALRECDVVVYDDLVSAEVLAFAPESAERIAVGKRAGRPSVSQFRINELLVELGRAGHVVVRLKGGDPFVFGRGGEEAEALAAAGVSWSVVPGVSSGIAAPAYAGIPLTHRGVASSVLFVTGHEATGKSAGVNWEAAARSADTIVVFMCARTIDNVARRLISGGRSPATPIALVRWGTLGRQEVYRGTIGDAAIGRASAVESPALAVIGDVVDLRDWLRWFDGDTAEFGLDGAPRRVEEEVFDVLGVA